MRDKQPGRQRLYREAEKESEKRWEGEEETAM